MPFELPPELIGSIISFIPGPSHLELRLVSSEFDEIVSDLHSKGFCSQCKLTMYVEYIEDHDEQFSMRPKAPFISSALVHGPLDMGETYPSYVLEKFVDITENGALSDCEDEEIDYAPLCHLHLVCKNYDHDRDDAYEYHQPKEGESDDDEDEDEEVDEDLLEFEDEESKKTYKIQPIVPAGIASLQSLVVENKAQPCELRQAMADDILQLKNLTSLSVIGFHNMFEKMGNVSSRVPQLKSLSIKANKHSDNKKLLNPRLVQMLSPMEHLSELHLSHCKLTFKCITTLLSSSPLMTKLKSLSISYTTDGDKLAELISKSEAVSNLKALALPGSTLNQKGILALANCTHLTGLRSLNVVITHFISRRLLDPLLYSNHFLSLTSLTCSPPKETPEDGTAEDFFMYEVKQQPATREWKLQELNMTRHSKLSYFITFPFVVNLPSLVNVTRLNLSTRVFGEMYDLSIIFGKDSALKNVRELRIDGCPVLISQPKQFMACTLLQKLELLSLEFSQFAQEEVDCVIHNPNLTNLVDLTLMWCRVHFLDLLHDVLTSTTLSSLRKIRIAGDPFGDARSKYLSSSVTASALTQKIMDHYRSASPKKRWKTVKFGHVTMSQREFIDNVGEIISKVREDGIHIEAFGAPEQKR